MSIQEAIAKDLTVINRAAGIECKYCGELNEVRCEAQCGIREDLANAKERAERFGEKDNPAATKHTVAAYRFVREVKPRD